PDHLDLHSFPTRRSSDLQKKAVRLFGQLLLVTFVKKITASKVPFFLCKYRTLLQKSNFQLYLASFYFSSNPLRRFFVRRQLLKRSEEHTSELQSRENLVC